MRLGQSTLSDDERRTEARKLLDNIRKAPSLSELTEKEREFVEKITQDFQKYADRTFVSPNVLFWLRDIHMKV